MGGTGGPGSSRAEAQHGLQGAGLLSGSNPLAPGATTRALGVEGAAQPATTQLAGKATGPAATPLPTSASDTPAGAVLAVAPPPPPVPNLGLPSAAMPLGEVQHVPFGVPATTAVAPTVSAAPRPTVSAAAPGAAGAAGAAQSPSDWLYPGNLPMDFDPRQGEFGMPRPYAATGPFYTSGYGAAGNFGGQAGHGPLQEGPKDPVLPQMAAGTQLTGAQIDQYNRVSRADYDRYMKLYGVGYDLPAYRNALNGLVYQQNMLNYTPGGGG